MGRQNPPLLAFNRGLISPKALARVDLDRTQMSAEVMTNWIPKSQGAMNLRPGTRYIGQIYGDTACELIEFVAAVDETALVELTHNRMRVWIDDTLLTRPAVDTKLTRSDTGWFDSSTGGQITDTGASPAQDAIPQMTAATTDGVTITATSDNSETPFGGRAWNAADNSTTTWWQDTGDGNDSLPSWWKVNFGSGNTKALSSYSVTAGWLSEQLDNAPGAWNLLTSNFDTGTYLTDTGKWTLEDVRSAQTGWSLSEKRTFVLPGHDTGTVEARRHWSLYFTGTAGGPHLITAEIEFLTGAASAGSTVFNATAIGSLARREKRVMVSDTGTEHSLYIHVSRGPLTLRVGSTQQSDDLVTETQIGTGYHSLAFTPTTTSFWVTVQTDEILNRILNTITIGDTGIVVLTTPFEADNLDDIRYDQSADVVYVDCDGVRPQKIERRGTGRSWSIVDYSPNTGPFRAFASSDAKLSVSNFYGNTRMSSDKPFFRQSHEGSLFRLFFEGQSGTWPLGALDATTEPFEITGVADTGDTGTPSEESERRADLTVTGTYTGEITIERSFDGPDFGFHKVHKKYVNGGSGNAVDTGSMVKNVNDRDTNLSVWYRARMSQYTSGVAIVSWFYPGGGVWGTARVTDFHTDTGVSIEVLSRFSDTGKKTASWQEGDFSERRGYPTAVALHGGRLCHAKGGSVYLSASDGFENFDDLEEVGDAAPIIRTLGSGPVDNISYLISLLRLIIGTSGAEIAIRSSSLDEPITPDNSSASTFSTLGSANVRAVKIDTRAVIVQRSGQRVFMVGFDVNALGDYSAEELTLLVPDLLEAGIVSVAVQRQPDTRVHFALADGRVGILTYEPQDEKNVLCWSLWEGDTGTGAQVERVVGLPATGEDEIYYVVRRTINGTTRRYLEKWAMETQTRGDTGLTYLADCAAELTSGVGDSGVFKGGLAHLRGATVVVVAQDTGQPTAMRDLSPDQVAGQKEYTVNDSGYITLDTGNFTNLVAGLPYTATWKSAKLAFAAEAGTALAQLKRTDKIAFALYKTHNRGLFFGRDTGNLDALPLKMDEGAQVDPDKIFEQVDQVAMPFPGLWSSDSRVVLRAKSPRPVTVLAAIPTVSTNEKI